MLHAAQKARPRPESRLNSRITPLSENFSKVRRQLIGFIPTVHFACHWTFNDFSLAAGRKGRKPGASIRAGKDFLKSTRGRQLGRCIQLPINNAA